MIGDKLETVIIHNKVYRAVESGVSCKGCTLENHYHCNVMTCGDSLRLDKKNVIWELEDLLRPQVTVGIAADGFSIRYNGKNFWFNQEDYADEELWKKMFKELGFDATIEGDY